MKNAVIYARYSSDRQNEMSIEGQIEECRRYAAEHDLFVVQEYIDRAQTATTDRRPNFLRMIDDSENGGFEIILVYQLDRFARNKNDSGYYKKILTDRGVKVVSAKEQIEGGSSSAKIAERLRIREDELASLKKQLQKEQSRRIIIGPKLVGDFLINLRNGPIKELAFQKMLVNALIDRIYLYDNHFLIMLHHSGPRAKAGRNEVREVERYFSVNSSDTSPDGVPIEGIPSEFPFSWFLAL